MTQRAAAPPGTDPAVLAEQVLARRFSPEALTWIANGLASYDRNDGALPLERCLGLPTRAQRRRAQRDYWLIEAARLLPTEFSTAAARAARLGAELDTFIRSTWCQWRRHADPPPAASALQSALFRAVMTFKARPCDKQLQRILGRQTLSVVEMSARHRQDATPSPTESRATP